MKYQVEISDEDMSRIVYEELKWLLETMQQDLARVQASGAGYVFSRDAKDDAEKISQHIAALKTVVEYYEPR